MNDEVREAQRAYLAALQLQLEAATKLAELAAHRYDQATRNVGVRGDET